MRHSILRPLLLGGFVLTLAACGNMGDFRPSAPRSAPVAPALPAPSAPIATQGAAETACAAAGSERGFNVQGIVGSADVAGTGAAAESRDVMLRVARGAQVFDLRCNYHYASAQARVMAL